MSFEMQIRVPSINHTSIVVRMTTCGSPESGPDSVQGTCYYARLGRQALKAWFIMSTCHGSNTVLCCYHALLFADCCHLSLLDNMKYAYDWKSWHFLFSLQSKSTTFVNRWCSQHKHAWMGGLCRNRSCQYDPVVHWKSHLVVSGNFYSSFSKAIATRKLKKMIS